MTENHKKYKNKTTKSLSQTYWCELHGRSGMMGMNGWFNVVTLQKYSQTAAPYPRLLDSVGDSEEREGDRDVEKGCSTGTHKCMTNTQGQIHMYRLSFSQVFSCWSFKTMIGNNHYFCFVTRWFVCHPVIRLLGA